jgi:hypothetical protein
VLLARCPSLARDERRGYFRPVSPHCPFKVYMEARLGNQLAQGLFTNNRVECQPLSGAYIHGSGGPSVMGKAVGKYFRRLGDQSLARERAANHLIDWSHSEQHKLGVRKFNTLVAGAD